MSENEAEGIDEHERWENEVDVWKWMEELDAYCRECQRKQCAIEIGPVVCVCGVLAMKREALSIMIKRAAQKRPGEVRNGTGGA